MVGLSPEDRNRADEVGKTAGTTSRAIQCNAAVHAAVAPAKRQIGEHALEQHCGAVLWLTMTLRTE
ncbi:hypothetical protein E1N52_07440 [Paraburkholderia guartelaensis]|uniref:Uncharacterized protein n=1 Tax=Paraburkholderia guartelaensis TaxID=2546446 RepID=A0A4V6PIU5_9BURK|nr:hypothetical protein [Paraburkholderia guartelaensis]TDG09611.1 hypothetical protein E1N52_07440 [Paraburkholderia guartelaensis]